jgi:pimeloyl-ACP methyl ester carboxylesterase
LSDSGITPFRCDIPQAALDDLRQRLTAARWPEQQPCEGWDQGVPLQYLQRLAQYWAEDYDWRRCERAMNALPQFTTTIDGHSIHFLHVQSAEADALPLLLTHGWPGSFLEFLPLIDALTNPTAHGGEARDAFSVVIPSLPGFGFSGKPAATGLGITEIGRLWGKLMARLGYDNYVAQGGDLGSFITTSIGQTETENCIGIHLNMPVVLPDPETADDPEPVEKQAFEKLAFRREWDDGYARLQSTRPQTLGYALADSPVGQLAWVVEKFAFWTDCVRDGVRNPEHALHRDSILDNITLYWLTNTATSAARIYWESRIGRNAGELQFDQVHLPTGCSIFPHEIVLCSRRWAQRRFTQLVYWNELPDGGHFAAMEKPDVFVREVRDCFRLMR